MVGIQNAANDAKKSAAKYYERAEYYEQKGERDKAYENYVDSLSNYASYIRWDEKVKLGTLSSNQMPSYPIEDRLEFFFDLATRLSGISYCCNTGGIEYAYIAEKQKLIFDAVSRYQKSFDVEQIEFYNALSDLVKANSNVVNENQEALNEISKLNPENESDEGFKKIREALLLISQSNLSLVKLETFEKGCFIATAAYSTPTHPDLNTFRSFRDEHFLTHPVGKQLVNLYYQIGPSLAQYVEKQPALKSIMRKQLGHLAQWMRSQGITSR